MIRFGGRKRKRGKSSAAVRRRDVFGSLNARRRISTSRGDEFPPPGFFFFFASFPEVPKCEGTLRSFPASVRLFPESEERSQPEALRFAMWGLESLSPDVQRCVPHN